MNHIVLGTFFILGCVAVSIVQFYANELWIVPVLDFGVSDLIFYGIVGVAFFLFALYWRRRSWKASNDRKGQLIEDFGP
jgi:hypothetical protein